MFNVHARDGKDPAFGKGTKAYNRFQGDALRAPNPCLKPLEKAPYYAIKLVVGDLGTYAGLATDKHSRVLNGTVSPSRAVCGRKRHRQHHGRQLSGRWDHARPGFDIRTHRGLPHRGSRHWLGNDQSSGAERAGRRGPSVEQDGTLVMGEVA